MADTNWYVPTTDEIKASATRLGAWRPEVFELWLAGVKQAAVDAEREAIEYLIRELPVTRASSWFVDCDWDTVSLEGVLGIVRNAK